MEFAQVSEKQNSGVPENDVLTLSGPQPFRREKERPVDSASEKDKGLKRKEIRNGSLPMYKKTKGPWTPSPGPGPLMEEKKSSGKIIY